MVGAVHARYPGIGVVPGHVASAADGVGGVFKCISTEGQAKLVGQGQVGLGQPGDVEDVVVECVAAMSTE